MIFQVFFLFALFVAFFPQLVTGSFVQQSLWVKILGWFVTFHIVVIAFVIFKASDFNNALAVFAQLGAGYDYASCYRDHVGINAL